MIVSPIFTVLMIISLLYTIFTDRPKLKKKDKKAQRRLFDAIHIAVIAMLVLIQFGIDVPGPIKFVTYDVAPRIYSLLKYEERS